MDERLLTIKGHRPLFLRNVDLPGVARAIVSFTLGRVRAHRIYEANIGAVWLEGYGTDVLVREEDWAKIIPSLVNGTFAPTISAVARNYFQGGNPGLDLPPEQADPDLYARVLSKLQELFPVEFPTSKL